MSVTERERPVVVGHYRLPGLSAEGDTLGFAGGSHDGFLWRHQGATP